MDAMNWCTLTAPANLCFFPPQTVDFEPMNVTLAPESYLTEGQPFLLSCTVKAFPQPIIKWFKNGHKYKGPSSPDTRKYHTLNKWIGILKFTNPSFKRDVGNYTCVAANKLETKNATTKLIFLGELSL